MSNYTNKFNQNKEYINFWSSKIRVKEYSLTDYLYRVFLYSKSITSFLIFSFLINFSLLSQTNFQIVSDNTHFQSKMLELESSTQTLQSDFEQEKHLSFMQEPIITKGNFYYKKDKKLRWEYIEPFEYIVIMNGPNLIINDEGHKNEIDLKSNKTYQEINEVISKSMKGEIQSNNDQFDTVLRENNEMYLLELTPKTKKIKEYMTQIQVYFDKKDWLLSKVILKEQGGDWTKINFSNKKVNHTIGEYLFQL